jgi:membrane protein implicated in regulation of membrane protease activity
MSRTNNNQSIQKIPEFLWLFTALIALIAAVYKATHSGQYHVQYFVISILSLLMYLYRKHRRIKQK